MRFKRLDGIFVKCGGKNNCRWLFHQFQHFKAISQHNPDLIFLDVQMPKVTGFEMLELLDEPPAVIFTTAFDEYAIKAFETHAVDYLLKPFSKERFDKAVQKWMDQKSAPAPAATETLLETASLTPGQNQRIVVKNGKPIILTSQPAIKGDSPTQAALDEMMVAKGYEKLADGAYYGVVYPIDPVIQRISPDFAQFLREEPYTINLIH